MTNWADLCPVSLLPWPGPSLFHVYRESSPPPPSTGFVPALGSRQSQKQLPMGSPAIQPLAKGQNPAGHLLAGPLPTPCMEDTPHLSGPLSSWSLLCSVRQVSLCQAERQVLGTAQTPKP